MRTMARRCGDNLTGPERRKRYSANMEDYLEAIRTLASGEAPVTVTRLSKALNVSKPSVTAALARLRNEGLVLHEKYGTVQLTERGALVAGDVCHRHKVLKLFLSRVLGVPPDTAEQDACRLEHHLSRDSFERLTEFIDNILNEEHGCPTGQGIV